MSVGGLLQGVGSVVSALSNIGAAKRQAKRQKELMVAQDQINDGNYQQQLADQRQLIDEERAYNDFGSVMSRAENAGVNPLYALGAGSTGGNISTSTPSHADASIPSPTPDPLGVALSTASAGIGQALDAAIKQKELEGKEVENESKEVDLAMKEKDLADKDRAVAHQVTMDSLAEESQSLRNASQKLQNSFDSATFDDRVSMVGETLEQAREQNRLLDEEYKQKQIDTEFYRTEKETALRSALVAMNYQLRMIQKADEEEFNRAFMRGIESSNLSIRERQLAETIARNIADHNLDVARLMEKIQNETIYSDGFVGSIFRLFDNALSNVPGSKTWSYRRSGNKLEELKR